MIESVQTHKNSPLNPSSIRLGFLFDLKDASDTHGRQQDSIRFSYDAVGKLTDHILRGAAKYEEKIEQAFSSVGGVEILSFGEVEDLQPTRLVPGWRAGIDFREMLLSIRNEPVRARVSWTFCPVSSDDKIAVIPNGEKATHAKIWIRLLRNEAFTSEESLSQEVQAKRAAELYLLASEFESQFFSGFQSLYERTVNDVLGINVSLKQSAELRVVASSNSRNQVSNPSASILEESENISTFWTRLATASAQEPQPTVLEVLDNKSSISRALMEYIKTISRLPEDTMYGDTDALREGVKRICGGELDRCKVKFYRATDHMSVDSVFFGVLDETRTKAFYFGVAEDDEEYELLELERLASSAANKSSAILSDDLVMDR